MKSKSPSRAILLGSSMLLAASFVHASSLTWDANGSSAGQTDGAGVWLTANQWWSGSANATWASGSDAVFGNGGVGGAVTLASATTLNSLSFNSFTGTYTLGTAGQTITLTGGITKNSAGTGAVTLSSPITLGAAQSWTNNSSGLLTVGTGAVSNGGYLLTVAGSGTTTVSGGISGAGGLTLNTSSNVTLTLSSTANTYGGPTTITLGRLNSNASGALSPNTAITITGDNTIGGQLFFGVATATVPNSFTISGVGYLDTPASGPTISSGAIRATSGQTFTGPITLAGDSRIGFIAGTSTMTCSGRITGSHAIDFYGSLTASSATHTFSLANTGTANDYTGNTSISSVDYNGARTGGKAILKLGASEQIPNGAGKGNLVFNGADANHLCSLELNGFNETLNGVSAAAAAGAAIQNTSTGASTLTIGDADSSCAFPGVITDGGSGKTLAITKIGGGTLTLSGANTYTGATTLSAGTLQLAANNAIPGGTGKGNVAVAATLDLNGYSVTLNGLSGAGTLDSVAGGTPILTVGGNNASSTFSGSIQNSAGTLALAKTGTGTLTLAGTLSYSGATTVSAGKLVVPSTHSGTAAATLSAGATLGVTASGTSQWKPLSLSASGPCALEFSSLQNPGTTTAPLAPGSLSVSGVTIHITSISGTVALGSSYPLLANAATTTAYSLGTQPATIAGHLAISASDGSTLVYVIDRAAADLWAGSDATHPSYWDIGASLNWAAAAAGNTPAATYTDGDIAVFDDTASPASPVAVAIQAAVTPASVTFNNTSKDFIVTAGGSNVIGGSGGLTKSGGGTVILVGGAHAYSGITTINAGTLQLGDGTSGNDSTLANSPAVVNNSALVYNAYGSTSYGGVISGSGTLTKTGAGTQTLAGANTYSGATTISAGALQIGNGGTSGSISSASAITNNSSLIYNRSDALSVTNVISGSGTLTQQGTGQLSLPVTQNTYSGGTVVSQGTLIGTGGTGKIGVGTITLGDANSGTSAITLVAGGTGTLANNILVSSLATGTVKIATGSTNAAAGYASSTITLNRDVTLVPGYDNVPYNSVITGTGNVTLSSGGVRMQVQGAGGTLINTWVGNLTIAADGFLQINNSSSSVSLQNVIPDTANLTNSGKLALYSGSGNVGEAVNGLFGDSTGIIFPQGGFGSTRVAMLTVGQNNGDGVYNGSIADSYPSTGVMALTKVGRGSQTLSGGLVGGIPVATSTFNGSITLNGGTLVAAAVAGTSSTVLGNASNTRTISVNSGATLRFDAPNVLSQTWAQANVPTLAVNGGTVTNADPAATGGNNNALGNVSLTNGTLNASVGSHAGYGAWDINGTLSSSGTSFITSSDPTYGTVLLNSAGPGLAPASTTVNVADGSLTISAPLAQCSGSGDQRISGLIKTGAGTLTLSGANTYSGPTTVSAGTLALGASGTLPGATAVSIATATLDAATFSATAGTLAVTGNSTIHLGSGATLAFAGSSAIPWSGTLVLSGTFVSGVSLRFGTTSSGLASSQLALITGLGTLSLDGNGFLILNPYASWSGGAAFTADANGDGIANGLAWVLGAANPSANGQALMPVPGNEAGFLTLHFKRSHTLGSAHLYLEYSNDLSQSDPWHPVDLVNGPLGDIVLVDVPGSPTDDVTVKIPSTHASPAGRLFGRLHATEN